MYTDLRAERVNATGTVGTGGARVWGYILNAGQGQYVLRDGGAMGTVKLDIGTAATSPTVGMPAMFPWPIRFVTDLHVTVPGGGDITLLLDPS